MEKIYENPRARAARVLYTGSLLVKSTVIPGGLPYAAVVLLLNLVLLNLVLLNLALLK
jgi:hypothetical protein